MTPTALAGAGGAPGTSGASGAAGASAGAGGAAVGGAGGAGGASGAVGGAVVPTQVAGSDKYRLTFGDTILEVDAATGARVSKLSLAGADLMVTSGTDATAWGSVFWTSPRSVWTPMTWPPPAAIDNARYSAAIAGTLLSFTGMADTAIGVSIAKEYSADATSGWITIKYTINAIKAQKAAPWEVSRVPRGGIAFFPLGSSVTKGPLTISQSMDTVWFDDAAKTAMSPDGDKLIADGASGWEAYAFGGNLFLKRFSDQPASAQAPGEGEICVYPGTSWIEFEVQGPYTQVAAGGSLPWQVQWKVVKIPSTVSVAVGSASLLTFAQQQVAM